MPPWLHADDAAAEKMATLVGGSKSEVAAMETLTANLHLLMASFYEPTEDKYKILLEGKAFPSDHVRETISSTFLLSFHVSLLSTHVNCYGGSLY